MQAVFNGHRSMGLRGRVASLAEARCEDAASQPMVGTGDSKACSITMFTVVSSRLFGTRAFQPI